MKCFLLDKYVKTTWQQIELRQTNLIFHISLGQRCASEDWWSYCSLFSRTPGTSDIVFLIHTKHILPSNLTSQCFIMFMNLLSVLLPHRNCKTTCVRGLNNWALCPKAPSVLIYTILPHRTATYDRSLYNKVCHPAQFVHFKMIFYLCLWFFLFVLLVLQH